MVPAYSRLETNHPGLKTPAEYNILVMVTGELSPQLLTELEKLPGSVIQICFTFLELALYLEHESFHLVMVIEGENLSPDGRAVIDHVAKSHRGTPVLVTKLTAVEKYLRETSNA